MNEIIIFLLLSLIGIVIFIIFYLSKKEKLDNFSTYLLILASCIITFGFYAPFAFTDKDNVTDFINTGQIGDTFGGIMNPFISIAAIIVTGLAFYAQYRANDMVRKQFELQKFENQFYEMLRLHKENVNEIEVKTADGKIIKGRETFYEMQQELHLLFSLYEKEIYKEDFELIYEFFFLGSLNRNVIFRNTFFNGEKINYFLRNVLFLVEDKVLKGHQSYLAHYFRHLFHTVKFVVSQDEKIISEEQKLDYLRILRAQLSNYEQIMLFYNWLGGDRHGGNWENNINLFFTKYKMIHNLWHSQLYYNHFVQDELEKLKNKYKNLDFKCKKGELFERND